jgi:hypothetical protein
MPYGWLSSRCSTWSVDVLTRERALSAVWATLVILTGVSWALSHAIGESARLVETGAILTIALVKVRLVGLDFMALRSAPRPLRLVFEGYVVAVWIMLLALCLAT